MSADVTIALQTSKYILQLEMKVSLQTLSWLGKKQLGDQGGSKRKKRKKLLRARTIDETQLKVWWMVGVGVLTVTRSIWGRKK